MDWDRRPGRMAGARAVAVAAGLLLAVAPGFSGLALLTVLLVGAAIGFSMFAVPFPTATPRPNGGILRLWLVWAAAFAALESFVLWMGDDLRWPTLSAIQDPLTTAEPAGRFLAGAAWTAAGLWLIRLTDRYPTAPTHKSLAWMVALTMSILAVLSIRDGAMLQPRDAPKWQAIGVDSTAVGEWPATAWLTLSCFAGLAAAAVLIHRAGARSRPPGAVPDLLAWVMAPVPGRIATYACWLWCGWHFLAR